MGDQAPGKTTVDPLYQVVFNLVRELWVVKDRQLVLEEVLKQTGIDANQLVDGHQPDTAFAKRLDKEREQLLNRVFLPMEAER